MERPYRKKGGREKTDFLFARIHRGDDENKLTPSEAYRQKGEAESGGRCHCFKLAPRECSRLYFKGDIPQIFRKDLMR